jgi:hypothetical protein
MSPMRHTSSAPSPRSRNPQRELTFSLREPEDLSRCVVLLDRPFTETMQVDGADAEVWLKVPGAKSPTPKLARQLGTGFLVATDTAAFLVTAGHVARRMDAEARLSCAGRKGRRSTLPLREVLSLGRHALAWKSHTRADLAVVRVPTPPAALRGRFLNAGLLRRENTAPSAALDLVVVGFPLGLFSEMHFAPISKRFHAASGILQFRGEEMLRAADFFLLDQPTMGGYSGAPVFVAPQVRLSPSGDVSLVAAQCVGVVSQTISDDAGGHFAAVVPSALVRSLIGRC